MKSEEGFSKTAFILVTFLCVLMVIVSPIVGLIAGKILGALALGWVLSGLLIGIMLGCMSEKDYKLNDDFVWRFSKKKEQEEQENGVKL